VVLGRRPQSTFYVSARPWPHPGTLNWVPSFWTQKVLRNKVWGSSGTLAKEQGSFNPVNNVGHEGPVLRPRCIGPVRAQTYILLFYSKVVPTTPTS